MANPKIGVQLNPGFGKRAIEDLPRVLSEVRSAGFDGVEAGLLCGGNANEAKHVLNDQDLVQWSVHTSFGPSYRVDVEIEYMAKLAGKFVVVSGVGYEQSGGLRPYEKSADMLNKIGAECNAAGLIFCYHNHGWEFQEFDGTTGLERLIQLTDPSRVKLCVDVFWTLYGGQDPVTFIHDHLSRIAFVHLKDLKYTGPEPRRAGVLHPIHPRRPLNGEAEFVELGRGEVDLPRIWSLLNPLNQPWVVYEQDETHIPPRESAEVSRRYLRERLGI